MPLAPGGAATRLRGFRARIRRGSDGPGATACEPVPQAIGSDPFGAERLARRPRSEFDPRRVKLATARDDRQDQARRDAADGDALDAAGWGRWRRWRWWVAAPAMVPVRLGPQRPRTRRPPLRRAARRRFRLRPPPRRQRVPRLPRLRHPATASALEPPPRPRRPSASATATSSHRSRCRVRGLPTLTASAPARRPQRDGDVHRRCRR